MSFNTYEIQREIRDIKLFLSGLSARIDNLEKQQQVIIGSTIVSAEGNVVKFSYGTQSVTLTIDGNKKITTSAV